ncbi:MAG TPA: TatD family hydrolase [Ferruginibacter sp.]|nr:TatD family hydrolase [Ferruginibacter sp.]HMP19511.1 TatD family hydrolase [Ferruginibacter sp.]
MYLVDTHTHLYSNAFKEDTDATIERAMAAGVSKFYLPAIDAAHTDAMLVLEAKYPDSCFAMMGLHPCSVNENYKKELELVENWLAKRKFVAVGEIGLDFYWDKTFAAHQYEAFCLQMEWALHYQLPIVIHTRNAMPETIDAVAPFAARGLKGIFHCFGDNAMFAQKIIDMGFYLGIGGVVTYKKSGLAETLQGISLEHIVLETDAPYLTPLPHRGKRNESSYLKYIAEAVANIKKVPVEEVAAVTSANAEKIFGV